MFITTACRHVILRSSLQEDVAGVDLQWELLLKGKGTCLQQPKHGSHSDSRESSFCDTKRLVKAMISQLQGKCSVVGLQSFSYNCSCHFSGERKDSCLSLTQG